MRRDKAVTRILLILSVVHAAASAPAIIRQRSLEVTKDVTPALEKRWGWPQEIPTTSGTAHDDTPPPAPEDDGDHVYRYLSGHDSGSVGPPPASGSPLRHTNQYESEPSSHADSEHPSPELGTPHLQPPTSGTPELQNHPPPAPPGSYQEFQDLFQDYVNRFNAWHDSGYVGPEPARIGGHVVPERPEPPRLTNQYEEAPSLHADSEHPSPELGTPHLNIDQPPTSGTPELQNHPPPAPGSVEEYANRYWSWHDSGSVGPPPAFEGPWHHTSHPPPSHAPQPLEPEAPPSAPETHTVFNDALKQGLADGVRKGAIVGAVVGASAGLTYGAVKLIEDHSHNKSRPAGRDLASGGVVIRGESMHPLPPKRPVSRANDKLRHEDLRLLSILTRRALERLD